MGKAITYILGILIILVLISSLFSPKNAIQTDTESRMSNSACNGIIVLGIASCNTKQEITTSTTTNTNDASDLGLATVEIIGILALIVFAFMARSGNYSGHSEQYKLQDRTRGRRDRGRKSSWRDRDDEYYENDEYPGR